MRPPFSQCLCVSLLIGCFGFSAVSADDPISAKSPVRWWKGNLHTHSLWSDGTDFPEMIAEWYRTRDYNFLALSDHNVLSEGERYMNYSDITRRGGETVLTKYLARFGDNWVETKGQSGTDEYQVRLKPLSEVRALVEQRGQFIMIQGEEITDRYDGHPVHMNATNLLELISPVGGDSIVATINNNLRAVQEQARKRSRPIMVHINHPNYRSAITAEELAEVINEKFFEVYNGHPAVGHLGNDGLPGVERMWDICNTIRISKLSAPAMYGLGTDDSHEWHGREGSRPGRGWVMVRSRFLTAESLIHAMEKGDFYASSGVVLNDVEFDSVVSVLKVEVDPVQGETYQVQFIGTLIGYDETVQRRLGKNGKPRRATGKYSSDVGKVLQTTKGTSATYQLTGQELYVRAVVTSSAEPDDPSFENQKKQAWTQPVGWLKHIR